MSGSSGRLFAPPGAAPFDAPAGVRSDPSDEKSTIEFDDGIFTPGAVIGGDLIVVDRAQETAITVVRGIDLKSGEERWAHDAQSAALVGAALFVVEDGRIFATSDPDIVIVDTIEDEVEVCPLTENGFECFETVVDGDLVGVADDVFYVIDNDTLVAYDLHDTRKQLWSIDLDEGQSLSALDGKIAIYGAHHDAQTSTIDVYG